MSRKNGKDYLFLIWKQPESRRQYVVGILSKNGGFEFAYAEDIGDLPELPPADQLISRRIFADGVSPPGHRDRQVLRDILPCGEKFQLPVGAG